MRINRQDTINVAIVVISETHLIRAAFQRKRIRKTPSNGRNVVIVSIG